MVRGDQPPSQQLLPWGGGARIPMKDSWPSGRLVGGWLPHLWETAVFSLEQFEINGMDGGGQTW